MRIKIWAGIAGILVLVSCTPQHPAPPKTTAAVAPAAVAPAPLQAQISFPEWLAAFRGTAIAKGIRVETVDRALGTITFLPRVIELDHRQPEVKFTFDTYIDHIVNDARVTAGQKRSIEDAAQLDDASRQYGVPANMILALWGIETDYGASIGNFPILSSLATLAYEGRRAALFKRELLAALTILDRTALPPEALRGSWAGAMGQTQFMPSSFLNYAVDVTGGGKPDIWTSKPDIFASIANYLAKSGWDGQNGWGLEVELPPGFDPALIANLSGKIAKPVQAWQILGVRAGDGGDLPQFQGPMSLVQPGGATGPTLLVTGNYRVILQWNRSLYFATAVCFLADRITN